MVKNRIAFWLAGGLGIIVVGWAALWLWRSQTVVWEADSTVLPLVAAVKADADGVADNPGFWPWQTPDLRLSWLDPWKDGGDLLLDRTKLPSLAAFEVLGVLTAGEAPRDWSAWTADLDRVKGQIPLAVAGKSDAELLTLVLWLAEAAGPEALAADFQKLAQSPAEGIEASGTLSKDHPWRRAVDTLVQWRTSGRLSPNWWDYSDADVAQAVAEGRARYGLTWSGRHFPQAGTQAFSFAVPPSWPGRLNFSLFGRWLQVAQPGGWAAQTLVAERRKSLASVGTSQVWLRERGLLLADPQLPAVNQQSKALAFAQFAAAAWIAAPASPDLPRWKPLADAIRAAVLR